MILMSNDLLSPEVSSRSLPFPPRRDWILCDASFVGPVPVATCDVSVVCSRPFPVDCVIVELAEELKNCLLWWFFVVLKTFYVFFMFRAFHMAHQG